MFGKSAKGGKGKSFDGNAKGRGKNSDRGMGHKLPRTRITAEKFAGSVVGWQGKYGWVKATEDIEHEKAGLRGGKLFCGPEDVTNRDRLEVGMQVLFHIYEDDQGLGADDIEVTDDSEVVPESEIKKSKGKGGSKGWNNGGAAAVPWGVQKPFEAKADGKGATKGSKKGDGKDKGKTGKKARNQLPRTRITAEKFTGTVDAWKGKYGWIQPSEEIPHEKANKNNGKLYVNIDDVEGNEALEADAVVEFHIWEDETGLGAEEVVKL